MATHNAKNKAVPPILINVIWIAAFFFNEVPDYFYFAKIAGRMKRSPTEFIKFQGF